MKQRDLAAWLLAASTSMTGRKARFHWCSSLASASAAGAGTQGHGAAAPDAAAQAGARLAAACGLALVQTGARGAFVVIRIPARRFCRRGFCRAARRGFGRAAAGGSLLFRDVNIGITAAAAGFFRFFGGRPVQDQHFAQVVNQGAGELIANAGDDFFAAFAIFSACAHFDQPMGVKIAVNFLNNGVSQPAVANQDDRVQGVGGGA